jgi:hypothetical protein
MLLETCYHQDIIMKKRKLKAEFDYDFSVFGIISALKGYKLAWLLNSKLDLQLDKAEDIKIEFLKSQNLLISNYLYETEHCSFRLLKNKSVGKYGKNSAFLVPEMNQFDFLIILSGFENTLTNQALKEKISLIPGVQYVRPFSVESLKSKENLIF